LPQSKIDMLIPHTHQAGVRIPAQYRFTPTRQNQKLTSFNRVKIAPTEAKAVSCISVSFVRASPVKWDCADSRHAG
jgi:hypothetical protein